MRRLGLIGAGVVGTAIGLILAAKGHEITGVFDVNPESTSFLSERTGAPVFSSPEAVARSCEILFITTHDSAIEKVAGQIAATDGFTAGQIVAHMSGALTSDVLSAARNAGCFVVSIHPMQSFANAERAIANLPGSVFSIEGDAETRETAAELVTDLGGEYFYIAKEAKPLYHAGACVVSNYLVTLIDVGLQILESCGIPRGKALKAFIPLIEGTISNIERIGIPKALTGPIARGDHVTVQDHLRCLEELAPQIVRLYSMLGYYTADVANAKGTIDREAAERFQTLFLNGMARKKRARAGGE
ncbi:MAG: Rossmann-like and DUF2520 domain-containing protein [Solirubrobacterales bacterium]